MKHFLILLIMSISGIVSVNAQNGGKVFPPSEKVTVQKVSFYNRLGIQIVGDMYIPAGIDLQQKYPAIVVAHPYGGVKEQTAGLYAQTMSERGFVALAFDFSYNGESGGQPRHISTPEGYMEDISASVDFIGTRDFVNRACIGAIGICGSGAFVVAAAATDPRIKSIATVSMVDLGRAMRRGQNDVITAEQCKQTLLGIAEQRWKEFEGAPTKYSYGTPEKLTPETNDITRMFFDYYRTSRGHHPSSTTGTSLSSTPALMNFFPFANIELISPRPMLFIAGTDAHSRYYSEDAYKLASEPKELYLVPGANHVDLYDQMQLIPFDKLESFFKNMSDQP